MNATNKVIEKKIRLLAFEEAQERLLPFDSMKENVLLACNQRMDTPVIRQKKRKARLRNTRRVVLATACLLIGISILSVLAPVPVSTANAFLRKAQIWVGGLLQLNISYGPPEEYGMRSEEYGMMPEGYKEKTDWKSLQEIRDVYHINLLGPSNEDSAWTFDKAIVNDDDSIRFATFSYSFTHADGHLNIDYGPAADEMGSAILAENVEAHTTPLGTFYTWSIETTQYAQIFLEGRLVRLFSKMDKELFLKALDSLGYFN